MNGFWRPKKIHVLGMEFAGIVESVGKAVTRFIAGDQVLVPAGGVRAQEKAGVVHGDPELPRIAGQRFEKALAGEVEQHVIGQVAAVLRARIGEAAAVENGPAEIGDAQVHAAVSKTRGEGFDSAGIEQRLEIAALERRVPEDHLPGPRQRDVFEDCGNHAGVGYQAIQACAGLVVVEHPVRLEHNPRAGRNQSAERVPLGCSGALPTEAPDGEQIAQCRQRHRVRGARRKLRRGDGPRERGVGRLEA